MAKILLDTEEKYTAERNENKAQGNKSRQAVHPNKLTPKEKDPPHTLTFKKQQQPAVRICLL
jgi:hypothetical protein